MKTIFMVYASNDQKLVDQFKQMLQSELIKQKIDKMVPVRDYQDND